MCLPVLIPLALMAGGMGMQYFGEKKAAHARVNTFNAERDRQKKFSDAQQSRFEDSLAKTTDMTTPAAIAAAAAKREGALASSIAPTNTAASYLPGSSSAPSVVADAKAQAAGKSAAYAGNLANALAALGGTGDQLTELNTGIGRNNELISQINSFKAGSMGVLDDEMRAAAGKGAVLRGLGGLAQQIGQAWLTGGMGGGAGAGAAAGVRSAASAPAGLIPFGAI